MLSLLDSKTGTYCTCMTIVSFKQKNPHIPFTMPSCRNCQAEFTADLFMNHVRSCKASSAQAGKTTFSCFNCGEVGHRKSECTNARRKKLCRMEKELIRKGYSVFRILYTCVIMCTCVSLQLFSYGVPPKTPSTCKMPIGYCFTRYVCL